MSDLTSGVANGGTLHSHAPAPPQRPQPKPRTLLTPWEAAEPRAASRDFRSASQESAPAETPARAAQHMGDTPDQSNKAYVLTPSTPDISESGYMLAKPLSTSEVEDTNHVTTDANSSGIQRLSHSYLELQSISSTFPDSSQSPELEIPPPLPPRTHPATHPTTVNSTPPRGSAHLNASHSDHAARTIEFHTTETFQTADDIWAYFENPSSGGGSGDVDSVTIDPNKRLVHVTFTTAEVAQRVASRPLAVGGETVIVRLCRAPSRPEVFYPDRLMFQDVPENVNKQSLELYLEIVTGLKPTEILYGDEPGVVVVTFEGQPDVTKVRTNCQERPLEGRQLPVSAVQVSNCILVEGLSLNTTQETITLYFESKRNNGDTVGKVVMKDKRECVVSFENPEAVDRVLQKTHFLDKRQVKVRRYFDCLGPSGGTVDPNQLPIPNPLTLKDVSKHKRVFIQQCPEVSKSFYTHLAQVHAKPVFFDEAMTCECVVTSDVDNPRLVLKNWASEVRKAVLHFFNEIDVHRVSIPPDVWVDAEEELSGEILSSYPQASLFWSPADSVCVVVGMRAAATKLHVLVSKTVKGLKEEIERRRLKVVETYTKLKPYQLRLLEAVSFDKDMVKTYSDLTVEIDTQKEQVVFHGFSRDIRQAQSDMLRHVSTIKCAKLSRLTLTQKKALFTAESTHFIQTELRSENLIAEWEKGKSEDIFVYAFREDVLAQVTQIIEKAVYEEELSDLSPYSLRLLQSAEWMSLVRSLLENHPGALWVSPSPDGRRIYVTGREAAVHQVKDELCHFLQDLYSEIVRFAPSRQSFVSQFWKRELALLENDLKREKVKISVVNDGRDIAIEGTPEGVNLAKAKLEELEKERILCHEEKLTDKVQTKLLESRHCTKHLEDLGRQHQVVISLQREAPGLVSDGDVTGVLTGGDDVTSNKDITGNDDVTVDKTQIGVANGATSPRNVPGHEDKTRKASDVTGRKGGAATIRVDVIEGEIAQRKTDVIVNSTSNDLDLTVGGVSSALLRAAGSSLQDECVSKYPEGVQLGQLARTKGHALPCKEIFHFYLEAWSPTSNKVLSSIINTCLETASSSNYTSITFPALGTGKRNYPREEVAWTMFDAVEQFRRNVPTTPLREVKIVIHQKDQKTVQAFRLVENEIKAARCRPAPPAVAVASPAPSVPSMVSVIRTEVVEGEIAMQKVDVIVNTASPDLDLSHGAVSSSILKVAGSSLQAECTSKYPQGVKPWDIAFTKGHGVPCKEILHLVLEVWSPMAEQMLGTVVFSLLEKAHQKRYTSIAFPALGTGNLGYPRDEVAQTMFSVIHLFEQAMPYTSLREVRLVIYRDQQTLQEFRRAERQRPGAFQAPTAATRSVPTTLSLAPGPVIPIGRRQNRQFAEGNELENKKSPRTPASSPVEARLDFQGLSLEIMKGDITEQAVDVIVVCSNGKLELNNDNTTRCLLQTCGPEVEQELKTKAEDFRRKGLVFTMAPRLSCARILFLNTDRNGDWEKAIARCLKEADTRLLQTVAIPPIGAGADNAHLSAKALFKAVTKFSTDRKHVQLLRMVTDDCIISRTYADVIKEKREKEGPGKRQNFFEAMKQKLGTPVKSPTSDDTVPDRRSPVLETRSLFIYADRRENIEAAVGGFRELAQRKVVEREIFNEALRGLNSSEMDQITEAGHRHGVELRISPTADQITLRGDHSGIFDAMDDINHILNTAKENRQQKRAATLIANIVQWYFLEITSTGPEQREYGQRENHTLEEAFQSGQKTVKLTDTAGTAYVIDFDKMVEYPDDAPEDVVSVIRRDKITGDWSRGGVRLPAAWNPLNPDVLVDAIQLNPAAAEYREVETNFRTTLDRDAGALKIKSVYRIQNQTLYQQYAVKRSQLERQNPGVENERTLWHGTSSAAVVTINNYGFSRSYCGKNATKFGEGVYFAVHPSYSLNETFTPRDSQGQRYIYQCKVLTGYATVGYEKMRFLPSRHGDILYDSAADDPSNPELFVIFNDTQAYPEYLITFTSRP